MLYGYDDCQNVCVCISSKHCVKLDCHSQLLNTLIKATMMGVVNMYVNANMKGSNSKE